MLRCLTQTPSVPAVTMQKPGKQRELAGRIPAFFFFFFFKDIHVNFSVRGKTTSYFAWILSMHFGFNKMASLSEKGVKTFHWKQAIAVVSCFC